MTLTEAEHVGRHVRPPVLVALRSRRRRAPRDRFDARLSRNPLGLGTGSRDCEAARGGVLLGPGQVLAAASWWRRSPVLAVRMVRPHAAQCLWVRGIRAAAALDHPGRNRTIRRRSFDKCLTRPAPAGRRAKAIESAGKSMLDVGDAAPQPLAVELQKAKVAGERGGV